MCHFMVAANDRALCRCGIRIPSAQNRCPAFDKDKYLELMFGDVFQARTKARICRTADCYKLKPHLHKTHCCVLCDYRLNQFSIFTPSNRSKSFTLSVTKVSLFSTAVTPIKRSNSSCIGLPIFLSLTFSFA